MRIAVLGAGAWGTAVAISLSSASALKSASVSASVSALTRSRRLDQAVSKSLAREDAARSTIATLLQREDVQTLAKGYGLDLRRAEAAVGTLQGDDLRRVSALAANADSQLAGGATTVTFSLVAVLLIIIIVILLAG